MAGWICQREGCGHNSSQHRYEWNKFRGVRDTSCRSEHWGKTGRETCRCAAFVSEEDAELAARARMVCSCTHHVDEHYWSPGGHVQGTCHFTENDDYPTCGCREYDGPDQDEAVTIEKEKTACG